MSAPRYEKRNADADHILLWAERYAVAQRAFDESSYPEGSDEDNALSIRASAAEFQLVAAVVRGYLSYEYTREAEWIEVRDDVLEDAATGTWAVEDHGDSWVLKDAGRAKEPAGA